MVRQAHLIAVVLAFLIGCAAVLMAGPSGVRAETSQEEKQGHTEATNNEQGHSGGAPSEEDRCAETRKILRFQTWFYVTNDVPGCPKGGLLTGTDKSDTPPDHPGLEGQDGDDKIRGLDGKDEIYGSSGSDVIYGGSGNDFLCSGGLNGCGEEGNNDDDVLYGGEDSDRLWATNGEDVLYGGDGNDHLFAVDDTKAGGRDKLYCGAGRDTYRADPNDYVASSCEKGVLWVEDGKYGKFVPDTGGPPLLLLAGAALCSALMMLRYAIRSA